MNSFDVEFCNKEFKFIEYINVCEADLYAEIEIFVSQVHYQGQSKVMFKLPHPLNFNIYRLSISILPIISTTSSKFLEQIKVCLVYLNVQIIKMVDILK